MTDLRGERPAISGSTSGKIIGAVIAAAIVCAAAAYTFETWPKSQHQIVANNQLPSPAASVQ